jgi:hypothetical protein
MWELLCAVARHAFPDDQTRLDVQRSEERGGAMALAIMGHGGGSPLLERQARPGPVQRLDLRLLVDAEHYRPVWRVEVEPDNLGDLRLEHRVVRDLEPLHDMRLQPRIRPTLEGEMPTALAIIARLQCVALGGISCTVFAITFSRTSLGRGGTREGRVLSRLSPGKPSSRCRSCQRQTVGFDMPVHRMISTVP